jgi:hypothetical protein
LENEKLKKEFENLEINVQKVSDEMPLNLKLKLEIEKDHDNSKFSFLGNKNVKKLEIKDLNILQELDKEDYKENILENEK